MTQANETLEIKNGGKCSVCTLDCLLSFGVDYSVWIIYWRNPCNKIYSLHTLRWGHEGWELYFLI